jgi:hypothetical protein
MRLLRGCVLASILAATAAGSAALAMAPAKRLDTRDTEFRLMAMLYLSCATAR